MPGVSLQADAVNALTRAHDGVNHAALLATVAKDPEGISLTTLLTESTSAYQEALSRYQASDLVGARELAVAADDVSRAIVELASSGAQRSAAQIPPPPSPVGVPEEAFRANDDLARAGRTVLEAQQLMSSYAASIPASAAGEARRLVSASQHLQQRGQALLAQNQPRDAASLARAADALAHAATHLQNRYLIAAGLVAPGAPPPGPPPDGRGRGRRPGA